MTNLTTPAQRAAWRRNAAAARAVYSEIAAERRERFAELIRGGYTIQQAAWELRVSRRTADRYKARLRALEAEHVRTDPPDNGGYPQFG